METGLVHLYFGEGKGKTTAAAGLALRAAESGIRVVIVQFIKNGKSSETKALEKLGVKVFAAPYGRKDVGAEDPEKMRKLYDDMLISAAGEKCGLLILDEICAARKKGILSEEAAKGAVLGRPAGREVVMTGRDPEEWMIDAADYITEMKCVKHPYKKGIKARRGIEY